MSTLLAEIEQQTRTLSPEDRAHLAEILLESLRDPSLSEIEREWEQEIENRVAAFDRGELQTHSAAEVFADARRMVR
ncbi:MAG: addiction module protein [Gallionella sp.]|jgi:putative addiction module component (TIGR02574 family)